MLSISDTSYTSLFSKDLFIVMYDTYDMILFYTIDTALWIWHRSSSQNFSVFNICEISKLEKKRKERESNSATYVCYVYMYTSDVQSTQYFAVDRIIIWQHCKK